MHLMLKSIKKDVDSLQKQTLNKLFKKEANRFKKYSLEIENLLFDYSKNFIDENVLTKLIEVANKLGFKERLAAMFGGEKINFTENRAVLHVAMRDISRKELMVDGENFTHKVWETFNAYTSFAEAVRTGKVVSANGKPFTDVIHIGIGGSCLPVQMACSALVDYSKNNIKFHFVANVDSANLVQAIQQADLTRTLFVVASKTFTTQETMMNAHSAKKLLVDALGEKAVASNFVALSTNVELAQNFGIQKSRVFNFWDCIGGRFSIWSSIALPLVIAIGKSNFEDFLQGAYLVDEHFKNAPLESNIPFIMALLTIINCNCLGFTAEAIIPYSEKLAKFPLYLQQVLMESNGKSVGINGEVLNYHTSPVIFGDSGSNAQHSFFQLLHQGSQVIPVDFIGFVRTKNTIDSHQQVLLANMVAQSEALLKGKSYEEALQEIIKTHGIEEAHRLAPHKTFVGNRPSTTLLFSELTPKTLGMLIALYEHKVFTLGVLWGINSFDQYGVELGKILAQRIINELHQRGTVGDHDSSTLGLLNYVKTK